MRVLGRILYPLLAAGLTGVFAYGAFILFRVRGLDLRLSELLGLMCLAVSLGTATLVLACRSLQLWFPRRTLFPGWQSLPGTSVVLTVILVPVLAMFLATTILPRFQKKAPPDERGLSDKWLEYPELPTPPVIEMSDWRIRDLEGEEHLMSEFDGKALFLNYWATTCGPCLMEMPSLHRLYGDFEDDDRLAFLFVSTEEWETVRQFAEDQKFTLPIFTSRPEGRPPLFLKRDIPFTVIFTADRRIAYIQRGAVLWDTEKTRDFLRALTGRSPDPSPESGESSGS